MARRSAVEGVVMLMDFYKGKRVLVTGHIPKKIKKEPIMIHLEGGPKNGKRLYIEPHIFALCVPTLMPDGYAEYQYHPTDRLTEDGVQIWK